MDTDKLVSLVEEAGRAYSKGNLQRALHLYEQAVLIDSTNHVLYANRSAILCKLARYEESLQQAEHSIRLNPHWAKAYLRKGDSLKGAFKLEKAMLAYCKGLTVDRENKQLLNALIQCAYATPIREKLCSLLSSLRAADMCVDAFVVVSAIGEELLAIGHTAHSITMMNAALDIDSSSLTLKQSVVGALSRAHYELGNFRKAIGYLDMQLEIAHQLEDTNAELLIHENIAKIAFVEDELALAVIHIRHQIEIKSKRGERTDALYETLGGLLAQMGEYDAAEEAFLKAKSVTVNCLLNRAKIAIAKNEIAKAIALCDQIERIGGSSDERAITIVIRCKCLLMRAEAEIALRIIRSAITLFTTEESSPHIVGLLFGILSECHLAVGQHHNARKWARKQLKLAIGISSRTLEADALRNMSNICEAIEDHKNALALRIKYDQLVEDDALDVRLNSLKCLANLNERCAKTSEAERVLKKRLALAKKAASSSLIIDAHSDLIHFYRRYKNEEDRKCHFEAMRQIFSENGPSLRESVVLEDSADVAFDGGNLELALDLYEKCLTIVQEDGDVHREAEVCSKLAATHWRLFHGNEAIAYYEHSLAVYQQLGNMRAMMCIYSQIARIHSSRNALQECHSCLRYCLTLAGFLGDDVAKLDALLQIGRVLLREAMYTQAKKVLSKALDMASARQQRREIGLIYGYLAECYIGFGNKRKAILNFCKQLPYFDYIDDTEGKCETLRHLIEEKRINGDILWTLKLCHNRVAVSSQGPIDLQVMVLEESAKTALIVHSNNEALKFTEKALAICVKSRHPRTLSVLLSLCSLYKKLAMNNKSMLILREYIRSAEPDSPTYDALYEIALCHLREDDPNQALKFFSDAGKATEDKCLKARCEYAICCCHFSLKDFEKTLEHLRKSRQLRAHSDVHEENEHLQLSDRLEEALVEWFCGESVHSLETIQKIANKSWDARVAMALDDTCLYEVLECERFVGVSALHAQMMRGDFESARKMANATCEHDKRGIACAIDEALILWHEHKPEQCATFLRRYLTKCLYDDEQEGAEVCLLRMHSDERALLRLLSVILIICICSLNNDYVSVETLAIAEYCLWHELKLANISPAICPDVDFESTLNCLNNIQQPFLYRFYVDRFSLLWHRQRNDKVLILFFREENPSNRLSLFYGHFLEQMLQHSNISKCERSEFERISSNSRVLINVDLCGVEYTHHVTLFGLQCRTRTLPQILIGLLTAGTDQQPSEIDHVSCVTEDDLIWKLQVCSIAVVDCARMKLDVACISQHPISVHVAVLLNDNSHKLAKALLLAGAQCVVHIMHGCSSNINAFLRKIANGETVEESINELKCAKIRIYGNRHAKGCRDELSLWRKAVLVNYNSHANCDCKLSYVGNPKFDEILNELNDLPSTQRARIVNLMASNSSCEIHAYIDELEDELENCANVSSLLNASAEIADSIMISDRVAKLLALSKRIFQDHLYGTSDTDFVDFKDDRLAELMKSFATKEREGRRRRRRKAAVTRGCWSEGEGSRRSSFSEGNTDTEAVVIDMELEQCPY